MNSDLDADARLERDRKIVTQYREGLSTKAIAALWDLTPGRIVQILNKAGVVMA